MIMPVNSVGATMISCYHEQCSDLNRKVLQYDQHRSVVELEAVRDYLRRPHAVPGRSETKGFAKLLFTLLPVQPLNDLAAKSRILVIATESGWISRDASQ